MRTIVVALATLAVLAGCSTAPAGPSLDQQQQTWEEDIRTNACEGIKMLTEGTLELEWSIDDGDLKAGTRALSSPRPYNCTDGRFERFFEESLVSQFPDSPKGQAGETTAPQPR